MKLKKIKNNKNQQSQSLERLGYGLQELAPMLDVSVGGLRLEIGRGRLKPIRIGSRVIITQKELDRYLDAMGG